MLHLISYLIFISPILSSVIPQSNEFKHRVIDLPPPIGEKRQEYDHEAFLGKDQVKMFDQFSPEESMQRLGIIYDKIDKDKNGEVIEKELEDWIEYVQLRFIRKNVETQWGNYRGNDNGNLHWAYYREKTYGQLADEENPEFAYHKQMKRDLRRWSLADQDGNGNLTLEEFTNFVHPEEASHMKDLIVEETLEDIDKDNDGKISLKEYLNDLWQESPDKEEPYWLKAERENFEKNRDLDNDGFMDKAEIKNWILPDGYNHILAETRHLLYMTDENKDGLLTKNEVLNKYDVFVGSQATDFGEAIRTHDEF